MPTTVFILQKNRITEISKLLVFKNSVHSVCGLQPIEVISITTARGGLRFKEFPTVRKKKLLGLLQQKIGCAAFETLQNADHASCANSQTLKLDH